MVIAELVTNPPPAAPGWLVLLLVALAVASAGVAMWCAGDEFDDFEQRDRFYEDAE